MNENNGLKNAISIITNGNVLNRQDVIDKLESKWGTAELREYILSVLLTNRPNRQGLPDVDFANMVTILELHHEKFPQFAPTGPSFTYY